MKTFISFLVLVVLGAGLWWWSVQEKVQGPASVAENKTTELCFAKFKDSADSEFQDKYTLLMKLEGEKAEGELRLLPAEKDALVGKFTGTAGPVSPEMMARTANLIWEAEGEAMTAKQELKIIFGEGTASIGFGEMALNEEKGIYVYADPAKVDYSFGLTDIACADLNEREAVEKYLRENIATLSPIAPVLGGNWYVVAATLDLTANTGVVAYEDGHVQEKRDFTYVLKTDGQVESLTIK